MRSTQSTDLPTGIQKNWRIGIVYSSFYKEEIEVLVQGAVELLTEAGIPEANFSLHSAPGSFEIPLLGAALAHAKTVDALIGIGIIVQGQTHHARLLAEQVARGIMDVQLQYRIPFAFEVLYVESLDQAKERSTGEANKGREAARAVLHSLAQLHRIG